VYKELASKADKAKVNNQVLRSMEKQEINQREPIRTDVEESTTEAHFQDVGVE
jgi:hypothetical protein